MSEDLKKHMDTLRSFSVEPHLVSAAETLLMSYRDPEPDPDLKRFFDYLKEVLAQSGAGRKWNWHISGFFSSSGKTYRHVATVNVHTVTKGQTFGADKTLMEQVKTFSELQVKETEQQQCDIIILFCTIVSRPGSDVDVAMSKVSGDKPVILVMMHHTWKTDCSIPEITWSGRFPNVVLNVNVLFHETKGLLRSPQNEQAVRQIQTKLKDKKSFQ